MRRAMTGPRSLRGRLSVVSAVLFGVIALLGGSALVSLSRFNSVTRDVRTQWLPNTRLLGDLNNYTSDYRAAEADCLLASEPPALAASCGETATLLRQVDAARRSYEQIAHDPRATAEYRGFASEWERYVALASRVVGLVAAGRQADASALYRTLSRVAYSGASDRLGALTDSNVTRAEQANARSILAYRRAEWLLGGMLCAAAVLLLLAMLYVQRSISAPLLGLARTMRRLALNDTSVDVEHQCRSDEIGEMARAVTVFRANAVDLAQSRHGLAQQATMLEEKLAHEQRLARMQRDFVSTVAHEFRTPLTLIDAHAQRIVALSSAERSDPGYAERGARIRVAVKRLVRLLDDMLDAARLLDGEPSLYFHPEPTDLAGLVNEVCRIHRELSPASQILVARTSGPCVVAADGRLMHQAVSNLLSNAVKYSPGGARIKVAVERVGPSVTVSVRDFGLGIAQDDLGRIFDPYYRGGNVAGLVGTGIGLHLVKTVVGLHGGRVDAESVEGEGSLFVIALPCEPDDEALVPPHLASSPVRSEA